MQRVSLLLGLVLMVAAVGPASACKYWCKNLSTLEYDCCDEGNPYYQPDGCYYWCLKPYSSEYQCCDGEEHPLQGGEEPLLGEEATTPSEAPAAPTGETVEGVSGGCYYYCAYDGEVYCCGDEETGIPENHEPHDGRCPEEEEQVCKSAGIFLVTKKAKVAKTSGSILLVSGDGKQQPVCASDGYCDQDQKCCPSKCARRHICLKSLKDESNNEEDLDKKQ